MWGVRYMKTQKCNHLQMNACKLCTNEQHAITEYHTDFHFAVYTISDLIEYVISLGVTLALQGDGLWNHCSSGTNPNNFTKFTSVMPSLAVAGSPTPAEKQTMIDWIKEDAQAKGIICRKLSAVVQGLLNETWTAREQWNTLATHFGHLDITSNFELRVQLFAEKLKDPDDAPQYISAFKNTRHHFTEMFIVVTDDEMLYPHSLKKPINFVER
ncbi:hypothetical protein DFH29DRAFT_880322 [Suillus ampliporus]|nr:hypothetical protein DFH29DRAFT_880322 [Suillus ampliporus]